MTPEQIHAALGSVNDFPLSLLPTDWAEALRDRINTVRMRRLHDFLCEELSAGKNIHPAPESIFAAFRYTPLSKVRVLILGQDPYFDEGLAHGLSFSVRPGVRLPNSLRNIFRELTTDLAVPKPMNGSLIPWAERGVLLLNSVLTVEDGIPHGHARRGWEELTNAVISTVDEAVPRAVFMLWGGEAQKKARIINGTGHCILKASHPSTKSASGRCKGSPPFMGSRPFSKANDFFREHGLEEIVWSLDT